MTAAILLDHADTLASDEPGCAAGSRPSGGDPPKLRVELKSDGVVVAEVVAIREGAVPLVLFGGQVGSAAVPARTIVPIHTEHLGRQVVLMFEQGDRSRPIIIGALIGEANRLDPSAPAPAEIDADSERLVVTATKQIALRCGLASITLTASGKILIQGEYVSSRASGVNRIKGGSVQIN